VQDKIAELNRMKAQLAQLKGIMSAVQNMESSDGTIQVCVCANIKCNMTV
jgi:exonuclease V gamma subunit